MRNTSFEHESDESDLMSASLLLLEIWWLGLDDSDFFVPTHFSTSFPESDDEISALPKNILKWIFIKFALLGHLEMLSQNCLTIFLDDCFGKVEFDAIEVLKFIPFGHGTLKRYSISVDLSKKIQWMIRPIILNLTLKNRRHFPLNFSLFS